MKQAELFGYKVYENGTIYGIKGKKLIGATDQVRIKWGKNKKPISVSRARFIYYAFNQRNFNFSDRTIIIDYKDGNKHNYSINNLVAIERKTKYQGEQNSQSKLTNNQVKEIKEAYITSHLPNNEKKSYRQLAKEYGVSHTQIMGIVNGTLRNEDNYIMK